MNAPIVPIGGGSVEWIIVGAGQPLPAVGEVVAVVVADKFQREGVALDAAECMEEDGVQWLETIGGGDALAWARGLVVPMLVNLYPQPLPPPREPVGLPPGVYKWGHP